MVSDLKTVSNKGCKIATKKVCFGANFAILSRIFVGIGATIHIGREINCLPYAGFLVHALASSIKKWCSGEESSTSRSILWCGLEKYLVFRGKHYI